MCIVWMNIIYIHLFEARAEFVFSKLKSGDYEETGEDRRDQGSKILGRDRRKLHINVATVAVN